MRPVLGMLAAVAASASASSSAQFTLEFQIVVSENEVLSSGAGGQLATLTPGTVGQLTIEVRAAQTNYPGWTTENAKVYDILSISLDIGSVDVAGTSALYPSSSPITGLQLSNDDLTDVFQVIRTDSLSSFLAWNTSEFAFSSIVIRQDSQPGQVPQLFQTTALPTVANLSLAPTRLFVIESSATGNPRVTFLVAGLQGELSPDCRADTNGDGSVTPADFSAWIGAFNTHAPACDQNSDSFCTPADFSAWVANYNAGC